MRDDDSLPQASPPRNSAAVAHDRIDARAAGMLVLMCMTWAAGQIATKIALAGISANWQAGLRCVGSALLVMAWAKFRRIPLYERDGTLPAGVICGLLFAAEFAFLFVGLEYTTASRGVIFLYMAPFVVAIGAHFLLPGDRLSAMKLAGLLCAFGGLLIATWNGLSLPSRAELLGDFLCFLAAICWGATTLVIRRSALAKASAEKTLLYQLAVTAITLPIVGILMGEKGVFNPSFPVIAAFVFQMIFVSFATFLAWFWLITLYPASKLAAFTFLTPVFAVILGALILREQVTPLMVAALALIAAGIFLVNRPGKAALPRTIRLFQHQGSGLAFDLKELLAALGPKAHESSWRIECVEGDGEELEIYGDSHTQLEDLAEASAVVTGAHLAAIANGIHQVSFAKFSCLHGSSPPWVVLTAFDSSWWDVESSDERVLALLQEKFPWKENYEAGARANSSAPPGSLVSGPARSVDF